MGEHEDIEKNVTHLHVAPDFGLRAGSRVVGRARIPRVIRNVARRGRGLDGRLLRFLYLRCDCGRRVVSLLLWLLRGCLLLLLLLLLLRLLHDLLNELQLLLREAIVAGARGRGTL